jgi:high affinity Mn2+ porin
MLPRRDADPHCDPAFGGRRVGVRVLLAGVLLVRALPVLAADEVPSAPSPDVLTERFAIHGQLTYVEQETASFNAPYSGPNSLSPDSGRETVDATLYLGARLWSGAQMWVTPEIDQGFGLDNTLGVAGFPSGEAYKVGKNEPYLRLPRAYVRQTISLSTPGETVDPAPNQLGGVLSADRWVFTVGKFAVTDVFDTNQYAHDPRTDFLNWSAIDAGSFDYAADAWGYTVGAAAEWYQGPWALRAGWFDLSNVPNSTHLDPGGHEFQMIFEPELRYALFGRPGKLLFTFFESRGNMGLLDEAVALARSSGQSVDSALVEVRRYRSRDGLSLSLEQELATDLGLFSRAGKADGETETYEFTDIDRSVQLGLSLKGTRWKRPQDTFGIVGIDNGISAARERYLNAGGLGLLIGDGQLPHPGPELILESYYSLAVLSKAFLSLDYQYVTNPAYNRDRGPASIFAVRVHAQF